MITHRGFSAWITCDDEPLPELLTALDEVNHRVSCWVPSEPGRKFSVHWQDHGGGVISTGYITLDGYLVPGRFLFGDGTTSRNGVRSGPSSEKPFVFQSVPDDVPSPISSLSSLQCSPTSKTPSKDLGTIILRIRRVKVKDSQHPANPLQPIPPQALGKRKAGDIYVGYGEDVPATSQRPKTWSVESYDPEDGDRAVTYVSFIFRYRSTEFLQSQGIMPPPKKVISSITIPSAPTRRIASAPAIPTLGGSGLPSTSLLFSTDSPTDSRPQSPDTPSVSTQTGASERTTRDETRGDGPPTAKRKRKPNQSDFLSNGPYRLRRPSDMRRAVSWRAPNSVQPLSKHSSKLASTSTISQRHTHEEPVTFNNPFASSAYPSPISRNNSLLMPLGSSDTEESSPEFNSPTFFEGGSQDTVESVPEYDYGSSSSAIRAYYTSLADGSFGFQSPSPPKHN